ncbi:MAG: cupin domain-containing protein [Phycisphaerales bacterium]|nr:MAG: cupin domain-containing protein [Phycisphaerales bacterium]
MSENAFPDIIHGLPEADVQLEGVRAWLLQRKEHQLVFWEIEPFGEIPRHSHGEQWGVVVEGELDLTIGGQTKRPRAGDSFHIPAGVEHGTTFMTPFRAIDFFGDVDRYQTRG